MCGVCVFGLGGVRSMGRFVSISWLPLPVVCFQLVTAHCEMRHKAPFWFTFPETVQCFPINQYAPLAKWQEA